MADLITGRILDTDGVTPVAGYFIENILVTNPLTGVQYYVKNVTSNGSGTVEFNFSGQSIDTRYAYNVTLNSSTTQTIGSDVYLPLAYKATAKFTSNGAGGIVDYSLPTDVIVAKRTTRVDVEAEKANVQSNYDAYLNTKAIYDSLIANADIINPEQLETYEPAVAENYITRALEFQLGTITPAIRYATAAGLAEDLDYLNRINKFINLYAGLYPTITINDGEGMPYNV